MSQRYPKAIHVRFRTDQPDGISLTLARTEAVDAMTSLITGAHADAMALAEVHHFYEMLAKLPPLLACDDVALVEASRKSLFLVIFAMQSRGEIEQDEHNGIHYEY
jgi:hypothetical protein